MTESAVREQAVLDLLRDQYESRGDTFLTYPSPVLIPPFLDGYRPDAIVKRNGGGGVVIEVKHSAAGAAESRLSQIAGKFRDHPEWTFLVVRSDQFPALGQRFATGTEASIAGALEEMDVLASSGHRRASFLTGWSVLEALARTKLASVLKSRNQSFAPTTLAETLEQHGLVTSAQGRTLRSLAPLRNSVVHGDFESDVGQEALTRLTEIVLSLKDAQPVRGELHGAA